MEQNYIKILLLQCIIVSGISNIWDYYEKDLYFYENFPVAEKYKYFHLRHAEKSVEIKWLYMTHIRSWYAREDTSKWWDGQNERQTDSLLVQTN